MTSHEFVQTSDEECESTWLSWPKMQEHAIENGTVLIWHMGDSVGHFIRALIYVLPLVHLLEIGLIINFHRLPAFRVAFEPAMVKWDVDPVPFLQIASNSSEGMTSDGKHALAYRRGTFILSDTQLNLLAETMGVEGGDRAAMLSGLEDALGFNWRDALTAVGVKPPPACAWNMLLRRSKYMVSSIEAHSPWHGPLHGIVEAGDMPYSAWHIRTSDGETADSFTAERNVYIFHNQSPADVCPLFISTKETVRSTCPHISDTDGFPMPVFISSNSKGMARNCSAGAENHGFKAGFVDLGIASHDSHTRFSKNPNTAVNAFIDFLYLMDASVIVSTGSSFSFAVAEIKGYGSHQIASRESMQIVERMYIFAPRHC